MPLCLRFLQVMRFTANANSKLFNLTPKFFCGQSILPNRREFPSPNTQVTTPPSPPINPNVKDSDFDTICTLLKNPHLSGFQKLQKALEETGIETTPSLLQAILKQLNQCPEQVFSVFRWAEKRPGYDLSDPIFNSVLGILIKRRKFQWALMVLMEKIKVGAGSDLVSVESFAILIKQYALSGMVSPAINTFKFGDSLGMDLFEVLLNALCKHGHVSVASDCIDRKMRFDPNWVLSAGVYNMLFDGWFRIQNLEMVERLLKQMRRENLVLDVVTYGRLIKGYCGMGFVDRAVELLGEMRRGGIRPDQEVYDPIVDSLARVGRFEEALGMLERFLVLEHGPTLQTYNCLIKGLCEAGDLVGAGKILKMMISWGVMPTTMTYNYFFRYLKKHGKFEDGVHLYIKMTESGYKPDQWTSHMILKMLCTQEEVELALKISKEMRDKEQVLDLTVRTMLIDLLCRKHRLKEAVEELKNLIKSGFVPKFFTYKTLHNELKKKGLHDLALKLSYLIATVPQATTLPITVDGRIDVSRQRRKTVVQKAKAMSDILKKCPDPRERNKP